MDRDAVFLLRAGLSRAFSAAIMSPVTLVKTRMEYGGPQRIHYTNTFQALTTISKTEGIPGLFRGLGPTVLTNAPFSALYYMFYTKLKSAFTADGRNPTRVTFASGLVAATAATLLTQPTDVLRTRMQLGIGNIAKGTSWQTLGHVVKSSGPGALLIGKAGVVS